MADERLERIKNRLHSSPELAEAVRVAIARGDLPQASATMTTRRLTAAKWCEGRTRTGTHHRRPGAGSKLAERARSDTFHYTNAAGSIQRTDSLEPQLRADYQSKLYVTPDRARRPKRWTPPSGTMPSSPQDSNRTPMGAFTTKMGETGSQERSLANKF